MGRVLRIGIGLLVGAWAASISLGAWAQAVTIWDYEVPTLKAGNPVKVVYPVAGYDLYTGLPVNCDVRIHVFYDCSWILPAEMVDYAGGHTHPQPCGQDDARPLITLDCLLPPGFQDAQTLSGQTANQEWDMTATMPEVSGVNSVSLWYEFPPFYTCVPQYGWSCAEDPAQPSRVIDTAILGVKVGLGGLEELPALPALYVRCGMAGGCTSDTPNSNPNHPQVFFGQLAMVASVETLASYYQQANPGLRLRILDMSLPMGGLFDGADGNYNWQPPHKLHRTGTSVDIGSWVVKADGSPAYPGFQAVVNSLVHLVQDHEMPLRRFSEGPNKIHFELSGGT